MGNRPKKLKGSVTKDRGLEMEILENQRNAEAETYKLEREERGDDPEADEEFITEEEVLEKEKQAKKLGRVLLLIVFIAFIVIIFATELVSAVFGKTVGTATLCVITAIIAIVLYRKEIAIFFKKNR